MSTQVTYTIRQAAEIVGEGYGTIKHWRQKGFLGARDPNPRCADVLFNETELLRLGVLARLFRSGVMLSVASQAAAFVACLPTLEADLAEHRQHLQIVGGNVMPTLYSDPPKWRNRPVINQDVGALYIWLRSRGRAVRRKAMSNAA